jgi:predicted HD superfamily hydrolase involved in NAD metabolism
MPIVKMARYKEFAQLLRKRLSGDKYSHSVFTAEYLSSFAESIGLDHDTAVTAGLLHDLCRTMEPAELLKRARTYKVSMSDVQRALPMLLHGPVAAEECRRTFGIDDAVYEAIYWHTTGRPKLGLLGCALYVADFAEPRRSSAAAREARAMLTEKGFEETLRFVATSRRNYLQAQEVVEPNSEAFYVWLMQGKR